jgi:hypothetical protein
MTRAEALEQVSDGVVTMLTALVLVCSLAATPDLRTCDQDNAVDVMRVPEETASPALCFMHGQAYLAGTEIGRQLAEDERVKVVCAPSRKVAERART